MINAPRRTNDPKHWRDRAAQMRALALTMTDSETTILMNDLAADYDKLADRAAIKANGKSHQQIQAAPGVPRPTTTPEAMS
jgi:hypothetical protein